MVNSNIVKAWDAGMTAYVNSMMQALWKHKTIPIWWEDHVHEKCQESHSRYKDGYSPFARIM
jgi:hypothetical protein